MLCQHFRVSIDKRRRGQAAPWYEPGTLVVLGSKGMSPFPLDAAQLSQ